MRSKIFVEVTARFDTDGSLTPLDLVWEDGRRYPIDRVLDVRRGGLAQSGGAGVRYTVQIGRCRRFLYYDRPQWFVEGKD